MEFVFNADNRIIDGFCGTNRYQPMIDDGNGGIILNPELKEDFFRRLIFEYIKKNVSGYESELALEQSRSTLENYISGNLDSLSIKVKK